LIASKGVKTGFDQKLNFTQIAETRYDPPLPVGSRRPSANPPLCESGLKSIVYGAVLRTTDLTDAGSRSQIAHRASVDITLSTRVLTR